MNYRAGLRRLLEAERVRVAQKSAAVCSWNTLTVLSLLPGADGPHTGLLGNLEHALAYLLAKAVTRLGFPLLRSRWHLAAFSAAAASFELHQVHIPGRHPGIDNWAASTAGAAVGILLARMGAHFAELGLREKKRRQAEMSGAAGERRKRLAPPVAKCGLMPL